MESANEAGRAEPGAPMGLPPGYDGVAVAKRLLRGTRAGALGTLAREGGHPFASLVTVATDVDGRPVLLMSGLSTHTKNLAADPRASILLAESGRGDPLAHPRLTVVGRMERVDEPEARARLRRRFLARHPKSALYADFGDFGFWRMAVESAHLNGGFAKAADFDGETVLTSLAGAQELVAIEEGALAHMNSDHADAVRLYATRLAGEADGAWRASGLDPEGIDLALKDRAARVVFPRPAQTGADLRAILAELAAQARAL
jgi:putative heme iron utilization protein